MDPRQREGLSTALKKALDRDWDEDHIKICKTVYVEKYCRRDCKIVSISPCQEIARQLIGMITSYCAARNHFLLREKLITSRSKTAADREYG